MGDKSKISNVFQLKEELEKIREGMKNHFCSFDRIINQINWSFSDFVNKDCVWELKATKTKENSDFLIEENVSSIFESTSQLMKTGCCQNQRLV